MIAGIAVDPDGHFCGQSVETGEMAPIPVGKVGFCGPDCKHCEKRPVYVIQDGIYVCAADYDYERSQP